MIRDNFERGYTTMNLRNPEFPQVVCHRKDKGRRVIIIRKDQIFYDIEAELGLVAKVRRNEHGVDAQIGTDDADQYRPLINRWIGAAANKAKDRMRVYVVNVEQKVGVDSFADWEEMRIELSTPEYWDSRVWTTLVDAVHNYIVASVLHRYYAKTLTEQDTLTISAREDEERRYNEIKYCINSYKRDSIHKPFKPFPL